MNSIILNDLIRYVYRIADKFSGNEDDDYRSESHTALVEALIDYKESKGAPLKSWIGRRVRHRLIDLERKRRKQFQLADDTEYSERETLEDMLADLPPDLRAVALLRWREGYSLDEIAELQGKSRRYIVLQLTSIKDRLRAGLS